MRVTGRVWSSHSLRRMAGAPRTSKIWAEKARCSLPTMLLAFKSREGRLPATLHGRAVVLLTFRCRCVSVALPLCYHRVTMVLPLHCRRVTVALLYHFHRITLSLPTRCCTALHPAQPQEHAGLIGFLPLSFSLKSECHRGLLSW